MAAGRAGGFFPLVPSSSNSTSCDSDTLRLTQKVDYLVVKLEEDKAAVTALIDNIKDEIASLKENVSLISICVDIRHSSI